jgi:xanthine dehydrogenase YagR molybdenum-binding subunit
MRNSSQKAKGRARPPLYNGKQSRPNGGDSGKPLKFAFGANFVEVRIHRLTREIRIPRLTGAFAAGRIINSRTARSQYMGAMIWGMEMALLEATEMDVKRARYINDNYADYRDAGPSRHARAKTGQGP